MNEKKSSTKIPHNGTVVLLMALLLIGATRARAASDAVSLRVVGTEPLAVWLDTVGKKIVGAHTTLNLTVERMDADKLIARMLAGEADAVLLPRPVSENELTLARIAKKPELRGYPIAIDAVVVIVHAANPLESISTQQVGGLLTQSLFKWQQMGLQIEGTVLAVPPVRRTVDGQEVTEEGPSYMTVMVPASYWGTDEWLRRRTAGLPDISPRLERAKSRAETVRAVIDDVRAIGFVSLPAPDGVKVLAVRDNAAAEPVSPQTDTIRAGAYPLAHHIYLYTSGAPNAPLRDLLTYLLSSEGQGSITLAEGFLPLPALDSSASADHAAP